MWRVLNIAMVAALLALGCVPRTVPDREPVAMPLPFGKQVEGQLNPNRSMRYLVRVDTPGMVTLRASWDPQEGMERIEWAAPPPLGVISFDARDAIQLERRIPVTPGFYYVEVVPWTREGSFRLVATFR